MRSIPRSPADTDAPRILLSLLLLAGSLTAADGQALFSQLAMPSGLRQHQMLIRPTLLKRQALPRVGDDAPGQRVRVYEYLLHPSAPILWETGLGHSAR